MRRIHLSLLSVLMVCSQVSDAYGSLPFTGISIFGDSLSDVNRRYSERRRYIEHISSEEAEPPLPYHEGRYSNGPIWVEHFIDALNITDVKNFAYAGSTSGFGYRPDQSFIPNVGQQIEDYSKLYPKINDTELLILWTGSNDFLGIYVFIDEFYHNEFALNERLANWQFYFWQTTNSIEAHIRKLTGMGGRHFMIFNIIPLGHIPIVKQNGVLAEWFMNMVTRWWNFSIQRRLSQLENELHISIYSIDIYSHITELNYHPELCGLSISNTFAFDLDEITYQYTLHEKHHEHLFFDDVHPTTKTHACIAEFAAKELQNQFKYATD